MICMTRSNLAIKDERRLFRNIENIEEKSDLATIQGDWTATDTTPGTWRLDRWQELQRDGHHDRIDLRWRRPSVGASKLHETHKAWHPRTNVASVPKRHKSVASRAKASSYSEAQRVHTLLTNSRSTAVHLVHELNAASSFEHHYALTGTAARGTPNASLPPLPAISTCDIRTARNDRDARSSGPQFPSSPNPYHHSCPHTARQPVHGACHTAFPPLPIAAPVTPPLKTTPLSHPPCGPRFQYCFNWSKTTNLEPSFVQITSL
ncbi:hypothetical protein C7974DRAFT_473828 [Boeremia exigua]|uniref:uncharacterized protein n=1 Tax=Boeremia exigua TaxID=749465 RepID=UPI001E8D18C1|nr:uncharacterized protein C7974DRAFT_473828 [Boeremia exigua]KAH6619989.1 hypothetical protein C7974DRAFT_473828 [Boeremia exigua]